MSEKKKKAAVKKPAKKNTPPAPTNNFRKITRGPLFWIVLGILAVTFFGQISSAANRYTTVKTSQILDAITKGEVSTATVVDKDQVIKVILNDGVKINGASKVQANYVVRQEPTVIDALTGNPPTKGWNVVVPTQSLLVSFLFSVAPSSRYFAGLARKSRISSSSCTASSAPASRLRTRSTYESLA